MCWLAAFNDIPNGSVHYSDIRYGSATAAIVIAVLVIAKIAGSKKNEVFRF